MEPIKTGILRAFWAATPEPPDEDATVDWIVRVLTGLGELDPMSYGGPWYQPMDYPTPKGRIEMPLDHASVLKELRSATPADWRESELGRMFHVWRTAPDGTDVSAMISDGTTSRWLRNRAVFGLSATTTADPPLCARLVDHLWEILRPDVAEALDGTRNIIVRRQQ